jgi:hypothetical protein
MGLTASEGDFKLTPPGTHLAICIGVIDLGTQKTVFEGKEKRNKKVRIVWELCNEKDDSGKVITTGKSYTTSLGDRATLRAHLQSWRGRAFTPDELKGFKLETIVGKPCVLTIIHEAKTGGGMRDSIASITNIMKGMPVPPQVNPSTTFDIDAWDNAKFDKLPPFLQKWILESPEGAKERMRASPGIPSGGAAYGQPTGATGAYSGYSAPLNAASTADEIPF